jgi:hypothetical protein
LLDVSDPGSLNGPILSYLLGEFHQISKGMVSETNILLMLAWKYGRGTNFLSNMPKEIFKLILEFVNEPPLFIQYAQMTVDRFTPEDVYLYFYGAVEHSGLVAKFLLANSSKLKSHLAFMYGYKTTRAIERDLKYIREAFMSDEISHGQYNFICHAKKVLKYLCKYETTKQVLAGLFRMKQAYSYSRNFPYLEYASIGKNATLLRQFYKTPENIVQTLDRALFNSISLKRKTKISFEEAQTFVEQVRRSVLDKSK